MSSSVSVPRLVIAAPSSGSGKTTVATGLMAAFAARGLAVSPHKVGPDYIDPGYHALASGRVGRNLDAYLCGPELVAPLFLHGARGCDLAVVEGVMGMFDGAAGEGELASTAHVAKLLRAPVVLVVDASSQSRSVAALVHGFASWDPEVRVAGVILNKVASDRHEELLREALESAGVPVFGVLRRVAQVDTPSRHLGLVPVAERRGMRWLPLPRWLRRWSGGVIWRGWSRSHEAPARCRVRLGMRLRSWGRRSWGCAPRTPSARRASSSNAGRAGDAGPSRVQTVGHASDSILRVSPSSCGSTFVWPTTGMKFVSPPQRGTMCWWRWAAIPAPQPSPGSCRC